MKTYQTNLKAFTLRETEANDAEIVFSFIYKLAIYEHMEADVIATKDHIKTNVFEKKKAEVLLALENDQPIGIVLFHENFSTFQGQANMYIEDIYIDEDKRHQGYGTEIFGVIQTISKERDYKRIDWVCLNWNQPSIEFYEKMGAEALNQWILFRMKA